MSISLVGNYVDTIKNYVGFSGRATRAQYWWFVLANFIVSFICGFIDALAGWNNVLASIYSLAVFLPWLAITVRRLRDAGYHWAWIFINVIPLIGQIVFIVLLCMKSKTEAAAAPVTTTPQEGQQA